ncbi:MAG: helix-hairpin-helix domain-containing protein [Deltaproteobacteria bacterium]|jgi:transcriptional accessory protein Tex/SPT6|nr:helix-hairpin-helix domain-containing protein [Deltaproteobacteria bacterium]
MDDDFAKALAAELNVALKQVRATVHLLSRYGSVPFIARYRKEFTGGLDEEKILIIRERERTFVELTNRREKILKVLTKQKALTEPLKEKLLAIETIEKLEEAYLPYKETKNSPTRGDYGKIRGFAPLALKLLEQVPGLLPSVAAEAAIENGGKAHDAQEALALARSFLAEKVFESSKARESLRKLFSEQAAIHIIPNLAKIEKAWIFNEYFNSNDKISDILPHRFLAMQAAVRAGLARWKVRPKPDQALEVLNKLFVINSSPSAKQVEMALADAYKRLFQPFLAEEFLAKAKKRAHAQAIKNFSDNLRFLLMAPPIKNQRVLTLDPFPKGGCALAVISPSKELLAHGIIYPQSGFHRQRRQEAAALGVDPDGQSENHDGQGFLDQDQPQARLWNYYDESDDSPDDPYGPWDLEEGFPMDPKSDSDDYPEGVMKQDLDSWGDFDGPFQDPWDYGDGDYFNPNEPKGAFDSKAPLGADESADAFDDSGDRPENVSKQSGYPRDDPEGDLDEPWDYDDGDLGDWDDSGDSDDSDESEDANDSDESEDSYESEDLDDSEDFYESEESGGGSKEDYKEYFESQRVVWERPGKRVNDQGGPENSRYTPATIRAINAVLELTQRHGITVVAVASKFRGKNIVNFVKSIRELPKNVRIIKADVTGVKTYTKSPEAKAEFPDLPFTVYGAIYVGRKLIDPMSELVKLTPRFIRVGRYQRVVDKAALEKSMLDTIESCVNGVGVELNSASEKLLGYVSGLGPLRAKNIVQHREKFGPFKTRRELLNVPNINQKVYRQCAGFLRISNSDDPLDRSGINPESYHVVEKMARDLGVTVKDLFDNPSLRQSINPGDYAFEKVGLHTVRDILAELENPGRDPRESASLVEYADGLTGIKALKVGQRLSGSVTNIKDYGAFVDVGLPKRGLIHKSHISTAFVNDVSKYLKLGQKIICWVQDIDLKRGRLGLTMIDPKLDTLGKNIPRTIFRQTDDRS